SRAVAHHERAGGIDAEGRNLRRVGTGRPAGGFHRRADSPPDILRIVFRREGVRPAHGDGVLRPAEQLAAPVEHTGAGATCADVHRNDQIAHQCSFPSAFSSRTNCNNSRMSSNRASGSSRSSVSRCPGVFAWEPPVKATTRMPAALPAAIPAGLSSTTTQYSGATPMAALA